MSSSWPFSSGGNTTLGIACAVLEQELAKAFASKGYYFTVTGDAALLPSEKITVLVNPDDPAEYVFSDDKYADVDNTMIKIGGALVGMAMFVFLSGKLLLKDYA
jgi:hypothetical protein